MSMANVYVNCDVAFGVVPVGTTAIKSYPIKNEHYDAVTFYVTRNTHTNPIYYVFEVNKYEVKVEGGGDFVLKISYSPNIPGSKDFDYFTVNDTRQNFYRFSFRGECIGPSINCSIRNLTFLKTPKRKVIRHIFSLTNNSKVSATFQFDCPEEEPGVFEIKPLKGTVAPQGHEYVTVRFSPQNLGLYARQLCCLILYHEPILLNLFGISSSSSEYDTDKYAFRYYPFPYGDTVSFTGYLSDSVTIKHVPPPISLTANYLDFGRIMPDASCQTLTTSLTNHMDSAVKISWENLNFFKIYPEKLEIPPKHSALYECRFTPNDPERLAATTLNGHVSWSLSDYEFPESVNVPIPINLRLIGHSFPKNHVWIPSISIVPCNVTLPLSLPNFPSWATFMIQSHGHLPVLYKLVPPSKTNFIMKPMLGLIRNFQIVVVQLESSSFERKSYIEKWGIELNGQLEKSTIIYVKAQTDIPRITVAENNVITFEPMQPGTQSSTYIPVRNVSFCYLRYEFQLTDRFEVDSFQGILAPNEEIFVTAIYNSHLEESGENLQHIASQVQCINNENAQIGEIYQVPTAVVTEVIYSELCALPQNYYCGDVEHDTYVKTCFYIYNFGESNINFKLQHDHDLRDVVMYPVVGKCGPKEKLLVKVEFRIRQLGKNNLCISYNNRMGQWSEEIVKGEGKKCIFRIIYNCVFPIFQIVDLLEHNFGHLFSNEDLWQLLRIDELNSALLEVNHGEIRQLDSWLPDSQVSEKFFYMVFAIKNISTIYSKLIIKRRQVCNCKLVESHESFTFRIKQFECPHKDMVVLEIPNCSMPARKIQTLTIKIKYSQPHKHVLSFIMEMSSERTVILNFSIYSIPVYSNVLSVFQQTSALNMGYVYIGLREPPVFAFWLYNHTSNDVTYKLDDVEIVKLCNEDDFPVLKCLNCFGCVNAQTSAPILFKFWPIEVKRYVVTVPVLLGIKEVTLLIEGYGTDQPNKIHFENVTKMPLKNKMISLSLDRLITEPILVSSFTERMFFIRNRSKDQDIRYFWKPCSVDGLVNIKPSNASGILKPRESHPIVIRITSMTEPCSIRTLLCCEFVDNKQFTLYEEAKRQSCCFKEFTVTDKSGADPEAEFLCISLPITVNIVGILDRDTCISVEDQMKLPPFEGVNVDLDKFVRDYLEKNKVKERPIHGPETSTKTEEGSRLTIDKEMTQDVLEHIVSDAVFSDYFRQLLINLKTEPSPLYSQIKLEEGQREIEVQKFFTQPTLPKIADICDNIVLDSLQATFHLSHIQNKN